MDAVSRPPRERGGEARGTGGRSSYQVCAVTAGAGAGGRAEAECSLALGCLSLLLSSSRQALYKGRRANPKLNNRGWIRSSGR